MALHERASTAEDGRATHRLTLLTAEPGRRAHERERCSGPAPGARSAPRGPRAAALKCRGGDTDGQGFGLAPGGRGVQPERGTQPHACGGYLLLPVPSLACRVVLAGAWGYGNRPCGHLLLSCQVNQPRDTARRAASCTASASRSCAANPSRLSAARAPGKSPLMTILGCLEQPSGGRCLYDAFDVATLDDQPVPACATAGLASCSSSSTCCCSSRPWRTSCCRWSMRGCRGRAARARRGAAGAGGPGRSHGQPAQRAFRRPATACRHRPGPVNGPELLLADEPKPPATSLHPHPVHGFGNGQGTATTRERARFPRPTNRGAQLSSGAQLGRSSSQR